MIRFSAVLVVIAVAVLIGGVATSTLLLVYVAIVLSAAALIALAIGVARKRDELFGGPGQRPVRGVMGAAAGQPYMSGQLGGYAAGGPGYTGQSYPGQGYTGQPAPAAGANPGMSGAPDAPYGTGGYGPGGSPASGAAVGSQGPRVTSTPGRSAPLPSSRSVTETRADLQALPDTPRPGNPADADATRTDIPPVRPDSPPPSGGSVPSGGSLPSRSAGSRPAGPAETRFDLSPVLDDKNLKDEVVSSRPLTGGATSGGGTSRTPETRYDMPALGETRGRGPASGLTSGLASGSASGAPETRNDLPAQPDTAGQYGASAAEPKPMTGDSQVAVIPGVPRYHAPGCILIRFMDSEDLELKTLDEAKAVGCTPCTACQSD